MTGRGVIARARRGAGAVAREALDGDRSRPLLSARSGGCGALPRVRASADGRWAPVPARARVRARATRSHGRGEQDLGGNQSLPLQLLQLRLPPAPPLRAGRRALRPPRRRSDCDVSRLRRRNGRSNRGDQPGARRRDDRAVAVQPRRAPRARDRARRAALDLECGRSVDLPSAGRARAARRAACTSHRDELVRQPEQGRRGHRLARPAPRPRSLRADLRGSHRPDVRARSCPGTDRIGAARRRAAAERRLSGPEPERPVLERARSRRSRAGFRPSSARAAGIRSSSATQASRSTSPRRSSPRSTASSPSSTSAVRRSGWRRSPRLRIATSRCFAGDGAFARWRRSRAAYVRARTRAWPSHSRLFAVGERTTWSVDEDARHLEATARRLGYDVAPPGGHGSRRDQAVFLTSHFEALQPRWIAVDAPARHGVPPRKARDARLPGVRPRVRRSPLGAGSLRSDPGDARRDARPRARGGRRAERGARDPDRNRHRALPARHAGEPRRGPCGARPARGRVRRRLVPEGRRRLGRRARAEAREGAGHARRGTRAGRGRDLRAARAPHGTGSWLRPRRARAARDRVSPHLRAESQRAGDARTTRSTRTSSPPVRREGRRACSSRWPRASRSSRRASGRHRASSTTARTGFSSTSTTSRRSRPRSCASTTIPSLRRVVPCARAHDCRAVRVRAARSRLGWAPRRIRRATCLTGRASAGTPARARAGRGCSRAATPSPGVRVFYGHDRVPAPGRSRRRRNGEVPAPRDALPEPSDGLLAALSRLDLASARPAAAPSARAAAAHPGRRSTRTASGIRAGRHGDDRSGQPTCIRLAARRGRSRPLPERVLQALGGRVGRPSRAGPGRSFTTRSTSSDFTPRRASPDGGPVLLLGGDQYQAYRLELGAPRRSRRSSDASPMRSSSSPGGSRRPSSRSSSELGLARARPRRSAATRRTTRRRSSVARTSCSTRR